MLGAIRSYFFEKEKRKRLSESASRPSQYRKDRKNHFGILIDAGNIDERVVINNFAEQLRKNGHRVKILGFIDGRTEGLNLPFDIFTSADLAKVSMIPRSALVDAFIAHHFDVLINTSIRKNYKGLDYISALSNASFRIGPWYPQQQHNPYDLCLATGASASLEEWIHELMHTLDKIY